MTSTRGKINLDFHHRRIRRGVNRRVASRVRGTQTSIKTANNHSTRTKDLPEEMQKQVSATTKVIKHGQSHISHLHVSQPPHAREVHGSAVLAAFSAYRRLKSGLVSVDDRVAVLVPLGSLPNPPQESCCNDNSPFEIAG